MQDKNSDHLPYIIGEEVLSKLDYTSEEEWPVELLDELADEFISFADSNGFANKGIIRYGKKIKRKIRK